MRRIRVLRQRQDMTIAELGARSTVHPAYVGQIENGRATPCDDSVMLRRIAKAIGWTGPAAALMDEVEADGTPS